MNYQCKNCGGNVVYNPKIKAMSCPYCDGTDCESLKGNDLPDSFDTNEEIPVNSAEESEASEFDEENTYICASCGGAIDIGTYTSAVRCPYCNNYLIVGKRIVGNYEPSMILPFKIDKDSAVDLLDKEFSKRIFTPASFLSEKTLDSMNGRYVPFFLYDYEVDSSFRGTGTKVRRWTSGEYQYTETSYYHIEREMRAVYDNIPVDASFEMDDTVMDLIEPYTYCDLMSFDPKYLSGFFGEIYNDGSDAFKDRAEKKAKDSAEALLTQSYTGYTSVITEHKDHRIKPQKVDYTLLPVWVYAYNYRNKIYNFYVNGQTGKIVGKTPVSKLKVLLYGATAGGLTLAAFTIIAKIAGVL